MDSIRMTRDHFDVIEEMAGAVTLMDEEATLQRINTSLFMSQQRLAAVMQQLVDNGMSHVARYAAEEVRGHLLSEHPHLEALVLNATIAKLCEDILDEGDVSALTLPWSFAYVAADDDLDLLDP